MKKKDQFFAFIPARKGSIGLKNKNVLKLNNKPLIEYTLEQVSKSKKIDRIYVSSNDERVFEITKKYKKIMYIKRKNSLSNARTLMKDVILDFLNFIGNNSDLKNINLVLLQPTSPQRKTIDIDRAIKDFKKRDKYPLISFSEPISDPNNTFHIKKNKLVPFNKSFQSKNRQNFEKSIYINGSIYIVNAKNYIKSPNFLTPNSTVFEMHKKHSIQIDDYFDFYLMKKIII